MITPSARLDQLRRDVAQLEAARATLEDGPAARSLDQLIAAKRKTLEKLTDVADDLERVTRRRSA